jgi:hypothetical protein
MVFRQNRYLFPLSNMGQRSKSPLDVMHLYIVRSWLHKTKWLIMYPLRTKGDIVLVWFFLLPLLLLLLLSEGCPDHNIFVFPDRSMIFGLWVHNHKAACQAIPIHYTRRGNHTHSLHSACKPYPFIHFKYACWSRHDSWKNAQVRYNN